VLPNLMRKWFGPNAWVPATAFHVMFEQSADGYILSPVSEKHELFANPVARLTRPATARAPYTPRY
jgi:hypothetical protein